MVSADFFGGMGCDEEGVKTGECGVEGGSGGGEMESGRGGGGWGVPRSSLFIHAERSVSVPRTSPGSANRPLVSTYSVGSSCVAPAARTLGLSVETESALHASTDVQITGTAECVQTS